MKLKRIISWICTLTIICQFFPVSALAQDEPVSKQEVSIEELLSAGDYVEGEALAIVRSGAGLSAQGDASVLATVEPQDVEAVVERAADTEGVVDDEMALRAQSSDAESYVIQHVVDYSRTTEEILRDLYEDPNVVVAEPNYQFSLAQDGGEGDVADEAGAEDAAADDSAATATDAANPDAEDVDAIELADTADPEADPEAEIEAEDDIENDTDAEAQDATDAEDTADADAEDADAADADAEAADAADADAEDADEAKLTASALTAQEAASNTPDLTGMQWYAGDSTQTYTTPLSPTGGYTMNVPGWQEGRTNSSASANASGTVCITDVGVDLSHPDLENVVYHFTPEQQAKYGCGEYGYNASGDEHEVALSSPYFVGEHGTHVAGIIASQWNDFGTSGIAHGIKIFSLNVFGGSNSRVMTIDSIAKGFEFLANVATEVNLKAINCSWGTTQMHIILGTMINKLGRNGVNTVIASGNLANNMDETIDLGSSTNSPYAIVVNAASPDGQMTDFSCYGQNSTDVFAPAAQILAPVPHMVQTYDGTGDDRQIAVSSCFDEYIPEATDASNTLSSPAIERFDEASPAVRFFKESPIEHPESEIAFSDGGVGVDDKHSMGIDVNALSKGTGMRGNAGYLYLAIPVSSVEGAQWVSVMDSMSNGFKPSGCLDAVMCVNSKGTQVEISTAEASELKTGWDATAVGSVYQCQWSNVTYSIANMMDAYNKNHTTAAEQVTGVYGWQPNGSDGQTYLIAKFIMSAQNPTAQDGTQLLLDNVSVGTKDAYVAPYQNMPGTSMAAPATAGALMVVAHDEAPTATLASDELALVAIERKAKLLAAVEYDGNLEKLCRTGGRLNLNNQTTFSKKAPVIASAVDKDGVLTVDGYFFGTSGTLSVDGEQVDTTSWSDTQIVATMPQLSNDSHVVKIVNSDGAIMQAVFSHSDESSAGADVSQGLPLYENDLTLPLSNEEFLSQNVMATGMTGCGTYLYAFTSDQNGAPIELWCYDTQADSWAACEYPTDFKLFTADPNTLAELDGKLYLIGGDESGDPENETSRVWRYDPDAKTWEKLPFNLDPSAKLVRVGSDLFAVDVNLEEQKRISKMGAQSSQLVAAEYDVPKTGFVHVDPDEGTLQEVGGDLLPYDVRISSYAGSEEKLYAYGMVNDDIDDVDRKSPYGELYRFTYNKKTNSMTRENLTSALTNTSALITSGSHGDKAHAAIAGLPDGIAIVGSDTLGQDTHIVKDDATTAELYSHTSCYHKAFEPSAAYLNGYLYAMGYNSTEKEVMYFRSTNYDALDLDPGSVSRPVPTAVSEPEVSLPQDSTPSSDDQGSDGKSTVGTKNRSATSATRASATPLPHTGDETSMIVPLLLLVAAAGALAAAIRIRKVS